MKPMNDIIGKEFNVLDQGKIVLVDYMGTDADICEAARTSYGKGTRSVSDDRGLIRRLMRNYHTSPFEMVELKFMILGPIDMFRQWIRHRTANVNEYSTRFSHAIDIIQKTNPNEWRLQSELNKQGSEGTLTLCEGLELTQAETELHKHALEVYNKRLELGVAREQARKDLPLSNYSRMIWKIDLHNLLGFLRLRMDSHAQKEIREYANIIGEEIVAVMYPLVWEAFKDFRLNSMQLTALDVKAIQNLTVLGMSEQEWMAEMCGDFAKSEKAECLVKLKRLGLVK